MISYSNYFNLCNENLIFSQNLQDIFDKNINHPVDMIRKNTNQDIKYDIYYSVVNINTDKNYDNLKSEIEKLSSSKELDNIFALLKRDNINAASVNINFIVLICFIVNKSQTDKLLKCFKNINELGFML